MRIPLLLFVGLFAASVPAEAQDVQLRMRMEATMAGVTPVGGSAHVTTLSIKGKNVRIEQDLGSGMESMQVSIIMNDSSGTATMLMHSDKTYMELPGIRAYAQLQDSAARSATGGSRRTIVTGDTATIAGYLAVRQVVMTTAPSGLPRVGTKPAVVIHESWVTRDPAIVAGYRGFAERAAALTSATGADPALLSLKIDEVPLRTVMVVIEGGHQDADAVALLRQTNLPGLLMRTVMEVVEVKLGLLPDSLFTVPSDYQQKRRQ